MSLDLSLRCEACGHDVESFNYTYNCSKMWYAARPDDSAMIPIDDMTGEQSLEILEDGLAKLKADPDKYRSMNPENGWGSYDSFVGFIEKLIGSARQNPQAKWSAWR